MGCDIDRTTGFEEEKEEDEDCRESEDKNYHILFVLDSQDAAEMFVSNLHYRPYTSLDESETCAVYHVGYVKGEDGVSLLGPFFASGSAGSPHDTVPSSSKDEQQCPVCLEKMTTPTRTTLAAASDASSSILTTVCNHSFHIDCLAQWQDSPCPVCRYDHSGLNETLSRCHICATTARNYVCLICGIVSCANGPTGSPLAAPTANDGSGNVAPQAPSHQGHALQHYAETLHAYALDTETQHVWDFAGGGYVHRLLQNSEDGKIVEGIDPRLMEEEGSGLNGFDGDGLSPSPLTALERSTIPTYSSSAEDDEAIHRKLEGFAGQYYTLLKSQLEQQRIFYEGRLEAIRREHENTARNERQSTTDLISALKQERNQLEQRCMTLRRKHKKVSDDSFFLENMNESLEADKHSFRKQIAEAQAELSEAKQLTQQLLTPLEEKVTMLMLQLENGISSDALPDNKQPST
jgi:BRCA1-associated protein